MVRRGSTGGHRAFQTCRMTNPESAIGTGRPGCRCGARWLSTGDLCSVTSRGAPVPRRLPRWRRHGRRNGRRGADSGNPTQRKLPTITSGNWGVLLAAPVVQRHQLRRSGRSGRLGASRPPGRMLYPEPQEGRRFSYVRVFAGFVRLYASRSARACLAWRVRPKPPGAAHKFS